MKRFFRFHRGSFDESIKTMRGVNGLEDIKRILRRAYPNVSNIHISKTKWNDTRTPREWEYTTHYVLADFDGYESQCVGMCNFYEE